MTLSEKAKWYEDEIDRHHRRTPYEYVLEVYLPAPGDKTNVKKHDSDNDGLYDGPERYTACSPLLSDTDGDVPLADL